MPRGDGYKFFFIVRNITLFLVWMASRRPTSFGSANSAIFPVHTPVPTPVAAPVDDAVVEFGITDGWKLLTCNKPGNNYGKQFYLCGLTDKWVCWKEEWESDLTDVQRGAIVAKAQRYLSELEALGKKYNPRG